MLHSIATVSISGTLEEKLPAIANAGFAAVEIFENDLVCSDITPETVGAMLRDLGLRCIAYQPFRDFEGLPEPLRARAFDRAERKFDLMHRIGTDLLMVCSSVSPHASGDHARIAADLQELGERAARRGMRVAYEALSWGRHVFDHRDAWSIVTAAQHPAIGMVLDSFHSLARKIPTDSILTIDPARIFLVQLADAALIDMDFLEWSRHLRCMPGQGALSVTPYVAALQRIGYDGPLSLEIFNDQFRAGRALDVARQGMRSLAVVSDEAARSLGRTGSLPPRGVCLGVAFVEFAAAGGDAGRLGLLFASLGFSVAGRHASRDVTLWRRGTVNLIINRQEAGYAHGFDMLHGASICAVGLRVSEAGPVIARARRLGMMEIVEPSGLGGMGVPTLRSSDGSLIYLIEAGREGAIWQQEFGVAVPGGMDASHEAERFRIDHLAAVVMQTEFLSWVFSWTCLFDLQRSPQFDVLDPSGVVQSRAIESPDGEVRLTVNSAAGHATLAARFVDTFLGAGYHHLAFRTDDIFATAAKLRRDGVQILPISANYYEDLQARHGLDEALISRLQNADILHDTDPSGGVFYQLYTRAFDKRFFFEFVQREGYGGYGAPNAQTRLAAQARYRDDAAVM